MSTLPLHASPSTLPHASHACFDPLGGPVLGFGVSSTANVGPAGGTVTGINTISGTWFNPFSWKYGQAKSYGAYIPIGSASGVSATATFTFVPGANTNAVLSGVTGSGGVGIGHGQGLVGSLEVGNISHDFPHDWANTAITLNVGVGGSLGLPVVPFATVTTTTAWETRSFGEVITDAGEWWGHSFSNWWYGPGPCP